MAKKTANDKLNDESNITRIVDLSDKPDFVKRYNAHTMLIASPLEYQGVMEQIPVDKIITIDRVRDYLATKHGVDTTCALTAGIFMRIVAEASVERELDGSDDLIAWHRTLKKDGELNEKLPGGIDFLCDILESEGHTIIKRGKRYFVEDYESKLFKL